ncbi:MAG: hypothetical protein ABFR90_04820 [Planctomycetota bacterium]
MKRNQSAICSVSLFLIIALIVFASFTGLYLWRVYAESKKHRQIMEEAGNSLRLYNNSFNKRLEKALEENDNIKTSRYTHYIKGIKDAHETIKRLTKLLRHSSKYIILKKVLW